MDKKVNYEILISKYLLFFYLKCKPSKIFIIFKNKKTEIIQNLHILKESFYFNIKTIYLPTKNEIIKNSWRFFSKRQIKI